MALNSQEIGRIAHLARLEIGEEDSARALARLNRFFGIVEQIRAVDTAGIEPLAHPLDAMEPMFLRLRDDVASETDQRSANQQSAPAVENGLFLVPRVIE